MKRRGICVLFRQVIKIYEERKDELEDKLEKYKVKPACVPPRK